MLERPVIIYDGECRFCRWSVDRVRQRDHAGAFEYLPRQQPGIEARFPVLAVSDFNTGLRFIDTEGTVHVGADGVYQTYRRLRPYHLLAWLYRVPGLTQLFRLGYAVIARNRHRFGRLAPEAACDGDVCDTPYAQRQITPPEGE